MVVSWQGNVSVVARSFGEWLTLLPWPVLGESFSAVMMHDIAPESYAAPPQAIQGPRFQRIVDHARSTPGFDEPGPGCRHPRGRDGDLGRLLGRRSRRASLRLPARRVGYVRRRRVHARRGLPCDSDHLAVGSSETDTRVHLYERHGSSEHTFLCDGDCPVAPAPDAGSPTQRDR